MRKSRFLGDKRHYLTAPGRRPHTAPVQRSGSGASRSASATWPGNRAAADPLTLKVKLHYAYKVRNIVLCIRDCAVALLRFCGLQTPQKRNDAAIVCLRWHRTGLNSTDAYGVIIARHFGKSDIQFLSLTSKHYFRINRNLKKYGNIEIT